MAQARKKSEKRQRNNLKIFRLNDDELSKFLKNCKAKGLSPSDYFRVRCCSGKALRAPKRHEVDEKLLAQVLGQLGKYGNNLNQVARALNVAAKSPDPATSVASVLLSNEDTLKDIRNAVNTMCDVVRETLIKDDFNG